MEALLVEQSTSYLKLEGSNAALLTQGENCGEMFKLILKKSHL
jgi:hypothetical protein